MPEPPRKAVALKACCYLGIVLLYMPNDLNWYWGNLVVYVESYDFVRRPGNHSEAPWLISLFVSFWGLGLMVGAWLNRRLPEFQVAVVGVLVYNAGLFTSRFSVVMSMRLLDFTMGAVCGLGYGLIQAMVYLWIRDVAGGRVALAYGLIANCLNLGAMLLNEVVTIYVNPDNAKPGIEVKGGSTTYFADSSVIDRVPSVFLLLGSIVLALHLSGLILIRISLPYVLNSGNGKAIRQERNVTLYDENNSEKSPVVRVNNNEKTAGDELIYHRIYNDGQKTSGEESKREIKIHYEACQYSSDEIFDYSSGGSDLSSNPRPHGKGKTEKADTPEVFRLRDALKTKTFYLLCFTLLSADLCYISVLNFYKKFGQLRIHDDHFLMDIGTTSSLVAMLMRLLWGVFMDKYGVKSSSVVFISCISFFFLTYYFTLFISRWMFAVWTTILSTLCTALYIVFPVASLKLFGPTNFADIYGAVMATTIVTNFLAPLLLEFALVRFGWFGLFFGVGVLNFVVLITVIWGLPEKTLYK